MGYKCKCGLWQLPERWQQPRRWNWYAWWIRYSQGVTISLESEDKRFLSMNESQSSTDKETTKDMTDGDAHLIIILHLTFRSGEGAVNRHHEGYKLQKKYFCNPISCVLPLTPLHSGSYACQSTKQKPLCRMYWFLGGKLSSGWHWYQV